MRTQTPAQPQQTANLAANIEKSSGRNFYAMKTSANGKEIPYAFEKVSTREQWLEKHTDAKPVSALEVYQTMHKHSSEALAANRANRVFKVKLDQEIDTSKGQRIIRNK